MHKNDKEWCPICNRGELREAYHLIYCTSCDLRLDLENDKVPLQHCYFQFIFITHPNQLVHACMPIKKWTFTRTHVEIFSHVFFFWANSVPPQVKLDFLKERLGEVHTEHLERGCKVTPKFCMETIFDLTALYIQCTVCGTFEVVI